MSEQETCPWCGSRSQFTDMAGTCTLCRLPWEREKWLEGVHDVRYEEQKAKGVVK